MHVAKGLIIADPWIGYILDGTKTWEMRSSETSLRGPFALIRKGTGAIWGTATLVDVGQALTPTEMIVSFDKHRIPTDMIRSGAVAKWNIPWILEGVRRLATPVPYDHPNGAVTWVNLADDVSRAIAAQFDDTPSAATPPQTPSRLSIKSNSEREEMPATTGKGTGSLMVQIQLTDGNIKNSHFYLRGYLHRFPSDLVGGSNKVARASKEAVIDWGGASPAITDIDGEKEFFRGRGWIKQFFDATGARSGDWVLVEETGPYRYRVSLKSA
jgi:hypothetical protein